MKSALQLYQTPAVKELEKQAISQKYCSEQELMERAGRSALKQLQDCWPTARSVLVFCGKGNNGGDGYVLARLAKQAGFIVQVYALAMPDQLQGAASVAAQACLQAGVIVQSLPDIFPEAEVLVDALLGTGIQGELRLEYQAAIEKMNALQRPILALDVPSGVNADTGFVAQVAVKATVTVTFVGLKVGLFTGEGIAYAGSVRLETLQLPAEILQQTTAQAELLQESELKEILIRRDKNAHKGDFGHVLVIGGDQGMAGAVFMAAQAAARVGAGLVSVATRPEHVDAILATQPELMCHGIKTAAQIKPLLEKATVILIGPGLGQSAWSKQLLKIAAESALPKVIDADALNLIAQAQDYLPTQSIFTPHPGEAARLLQTTTAAVQKDRLAAALDLQRRYAAVVVLKGAGTIVQGFHDLPAICPLGNPGMASGGMGDVLAGVIVGLLAQGLSLEQAARVGVYVHAQAGDKAALENGERGLLAMDLLRYLQRLVNP